MSTMRRVAEHVSAKPVSRVINKYVSVDAPSCRVGLRGAQPCPEPAGPHLPVEAGRNDRRLGSARRQGSTEADPQLAAWYIRRRARRSPGRRVVPVRGAARRGPPPVRTLYRRAHRTWKERRVAAMRPNK